MFEQRKRERFLDNSLFIGIEVQHLPCRNSLQGPFRPAATSSAIPAVAQAEWETRAEVQVTSQHRQCQQKTMRIWFV